MKGNWVPRLSLLLGSAVLACGWTSVAAAQDLGNRPTAAPTGGEQPSPAADDQVSFSAGSLEYDYDGDVVTATGEVRMARRGDRLRADRVVWDRKTGKVVATGNIAVTNPQGDVAYGDSIELTDSLRDGMVDNMLVVLDQGGRIAARRGVRGEDGTVTLDRAAYTPCAVETAAGCPKEPTWKITAVSVVYRPDRSRVYYKGAGITLFGLPTLPLPSFSHPVGGTSSSGVLTPDARISRVNGLELAVPYYWRLAPNRALIVTPHLFSNVLPMAQAEYAQLDGNGSFRITGYATESRRSDDLQTVTPTSTSLAFRGYLDGIARYQFTPEWGASASARLVTDRTFLRRYDISRDDRLRTTAEVHHVTPDSWFQVTGWYVQTLRVNDRQGLQPLALPEIDYRRRLDLFGGKLEGQLNTLALDRSAGQDTQRAFASLRWDMRRLTRWGQELVLTAYGRLDAYNTDTDPTSPVVYRGVDGFQGRAIGALAADLRWPLIGPAFGGTQRITPRLQLVAAPRIDNFDVPNEDARAVDLEDSNLFALNRFAGYDRFEDSTRATYGVEYGLTLPGVSVNAVVGQSYRLSERPTILYPGTGLADRWSDVVGRTEIRFRDFVSLTHRYRLDKSNLEFRRNEIDATVGSRNSYLLVGYLRLDRNIFPAVEDLQDREEVRLAGRLQFRRFWSAFGSTVIDLTDRNEDPLSLSDGFDPVRHRAGVQYEDDCIRVGLTWRRDYRVVGDARQGNSFLLTLALTNLGR